MMVSHSSNVVLPCPPEVGGGGPAVFHFSRPSSGASRAAGAGGWRACGLRYDVVLAGGAVPSGR